MWRGAFASLRVRLPLLVLLAVIPALGLVLYEAWEQRQLAASHAAQEALQLARLAAQSYRQVLEGTRQLLAGVAHVPAIVQGEADPCRPRLTRLLTQHPQYADLGVIAPDGQLRCSAVPLSAPVNLADRLYMRQALARRTFAIGGYQIGRITGKATLTVGYPVLDDAEAVQAVLFAALDLTWLAQLAAAVQLPGGTALTVLDRQGAIVVRPYVST